MPVAAPREHPGARLLFSRASAVMVLGSAVRGAELQPAPVAATARGLGTDCAEGVAGVGGRVREPLALLHCSLQRMCALIMQLTLRCMILPLCVRPAVCTASTSM